MPDAPELTQKEKEEVIKALDRVGANRPCPRCGNGSFGLLGGYFAHVIQQGVGTLQLGGPAVPTAVVVCSKCGWVAEHALGALDLMPKQEIAKKEEPK